MGCAGTLPAADSQGKVGLIDCECESSGVYEVLRALLAWLIMSTRDSRTGARAIASCVAEICVCAAA
jgi:hypothetical protein